MRLVTRSDFDGLVCAMILKEMGLVDDIKFVHPKDVQDGKIELSENDITTNLPYDPRVGLCFDHHESELSRNSGAVAEGRWIIEKDARSAARVVYNYYKKQNNLERISDEIMAAVDKGDSADFTMDEVKEPKDWVLMNFLMDARTGLGRFHDFRISNYDLMMELIDYCLDHSIKDVLKLPDVKERVDMYFEQQEKFRAQLERISRQEGRCVIVDLRNEDIIYTGNRFLIYTMFPDAYFSIHVAWGFKRQNTAVMIGKSIFKDSPDVDKNIGDICLKYGGGGHKNAGTCQLDNDKVDELLPDILQYFNS
ncbi:MAG TPA: exopolyphosphatase [Lachnospiraceae bacterium]|nr:exopolyphosphatase [Lachnospiraceae bacterium]